MARELIPGDVTIRAIKPGDSRRRLSDGAGLYLLLFVKGGAHGWRLDYTYDGVRKTISLGTYPDTGLAAARRKAEQARALVASGINPSDERKQARTEALAAHDAKRRERAGLPALGSFEAVAREWLQHVYPAKVTPGQVERTRARLEKDAFPWLGTRPIAEIDARELLDCLRRIEARGVAETARRVREACSQVFTYGIATGACARNPAADLRGVLVAAPVQHFAALTEPAAVGQLLRDMEAYVGQPVTRAALVLSALLLLRPGELRALEWAWLSVDEAMLTIPSHAMKRKKLDKASGQPHLVPLAPQALAVLDNLQPLTGHGCYIFPSLTSEVRCMSENTVRTALRRMGYTSNEMTAHGFRAMARTMADERLGVPMPVIEAQLAHAVADPLGRAYNRTTYLAQRRELMTRWADYLDTLRTGAQVVALRPAGDHKAA